MTKTDETEDVLREAFLWGTLVSPLAASRIAARVGAERLFGVGVLGTGLFAVMVPASWLTPYHVAIRIVQGIFMVITIKYTIRYGMHWKYRGVTISQLIKIMLRME